MSCWVSRRPQVAWARVLIALGDFRNQVRAYRGPDSQWVTKRLSSFTFCQEPPTLAWATIMLWPGSRPVNIFQAPNQV